MSQSANAATATRRAAPSTVSDELETTVFLIPGHKVKNGDERLIFLNGVARDVIESVRGQHPEVVFLYRGGPIETMSNIGVAAGAHSRRTAASADS